MLDEVEVQTMILGYLDSPVEAKFDRCISELAPFAPTRGTEIVRQRTPLAAERSGVGCEPSSKLFVCLCRHENLDTDEIEAWFDEHRSLQVDELEDPPLLSFVLQTIPK